MVLQRALILISATLLATEALAAPPAAPPRAPAPPAAPGVGQDRRLSGSGARLQTKPPTRRLMRKVRLYRLLYLGDRLGLTEGDLLKLSSVLRRFDVRRERITLRLRACHRDLRRAARATPTAGHIRKLANCHFRARAGLLALDKQQYAAASRLLTPAQQALFLDSMGRVRARMRRILWRARRKARMRRRQDWRRRRWRRFRRMGRMGRGGGVRFRRGPGGRRHPFGPGGE